ncbi:MAG: hypothetical protein QM532_04210, partial [Cyanobium sp. MAG06]|nr:hypothetical protein [Cyanobium sp. MAG06]
MKYITNIIDLLKNNLKRIVLAVSALLILSSMGLTMIVSAIVNDAELRFTEVSDNPNIIGSIMPASCESVGNYAIGHPGCAPCPPGTYNNTTGETVCISCPVGTYQSSAGQTSCTPCPVGQYQSSAGQTSCVQCPAGSYQSLTGQASCTSCQINQYQSLTGQTS